MLLMGVKLLQPVRKKKSEGKAKRSVYLFQNKSIKILFMAYYFICYVFRCRRFQSEMDVVFFFSFFFFFK